MFKPSISTHIQIFIHIQTQILLTLCRIVAMSLCGFLTCHEMRKAELIAYDNLQNPTEPYGTLWCPTKSYVAL